MVTQNRGAVEFEVAFDEAVEDLVVLATTDAVGELVHRQQAKDSGKRQRARREPELSLREPGAKGLGRAPSGGVCVKLET